MFTLNSLSLLAVISWYAYFINSNPLETYLFDGSFELIEIFDKLIRIRPKVLDQVSDVLILDQVNSSRRLFFLV